MTLDTFPGWKIHGESHSYLEEYDLWPNTFQGMMKQKARRQSMSLKVIENRLLFINKSGY